MAMTSVEGYNHTTLYAAALQSELPNTVTIVKVEEYKRPEHVGGHVWVVQAKASGVLDRIFIRVEGEEFPFDDVLNRLRLVAP